MPRFESDMPGKGLEGPLCGGHDRLEEHGSTVVRDEQGRWHTYRPDGTEIR